MTQTARTFGSNLSEILSSPRILDTPARASVAIVLRDTPSSTSAPAAHSQHLSLPQVLFIQRAPNEHDPWSAHIAFPGGWRDSMDQTDLDTACREAFEELGLGLNDPRTFKLLGRLNDRYFKHLRTQQYAALSAFVFYLLPNALPPSILLQAEEVASAFWVPISHLHAASPAVCTHVLSRASKTHPPQHPLSVSRLSQVVRSFLGLNTLVMPAVNILPIAEDIVRAPKVAPPPVFLWGLTLGCVGDVVTALGLRRVDWPPALPSAPIFAFFVRLFAELFWLISNIFTRARRRLVGTKFSANQILHS